MQIVAITGSIGCGKTTLAGIVKEMGYVVYDVDKWCRQLYFEAEFLEKIGQIFPLSFENGVFNKRKLRNYVFANPSELRKLEKLTHPFLKKKFLKTIHRDAKSRHIIFVDVAILFEMGWDKYCTYIILADTDYETQKKRVMERDHISAEDFEKIVNQQMSNEDKKYMSDTVVETNQAKGRLKARLISIIEELSK